MSTPTSQIGEEDQHLDNSTKFLLVNPVDLIVSPIEFSIIVGVLA